MNVSVPCLFVVLKSNTVVNLHASTQTVRSTSLDNFWYVVYGLFIAGM